MRRGARRWRGALLKGHAPFSFQRPLAWGRFKGRKTPAAKTVAASPGLIARLHGQLTPPLPGTGAAEAGPKPVRVPPDLSRAPSLQKRS